MAKQGVRRRKENRSSIRDREGWERKGERTRFRPSSIRKAFISWVELFKMLGMNTVVFWEVIVLNNSINDKPEFFVG